MLPSVQLGKNWCQDVDKGRFDAKISAATPWGQLPSADFIDKLQQCTRHVLSDDVLHQQTDKCANSPYYPQNAVAGSPGPVPPVHPLRNAPAPSLAISGGGASTDASCSFSAEDHDPFFCAAASIRARNCTASRATNLLIIQAGMLPPGSTVSMQMNIIHHHSVRMCMKDQVSPSRVSLFRCIRSRTGLLLSRAVRQSPPLQLPGCTTATNRTLLGESEPTLIVSASDGLYRRYCVTERGQQYVISSFRRSAGKFSLGPSSPLPHLLAPVTLTTSFAK